MKNLTLFMAILVLFTYTSFAQNERFTKDEIKSMRKAGLFKGVKGHHDVFDDHIIVYSKPLKLSYYFSLFSKVDTESDGGEIKFYYFLKKDSDGNYKINNIYVSHAVSEKGLGLLFFNKATYVSGKMKEIRNGNFEKYIFDGAISDLDINSLEEISYSVAKKNIWTF